MAVFPESMNKLDVNDVPGSLSRLESYIRYMTERVEFSMRNMTRNVSDAGVSSVEILLLMQEMSGTVATLSTTVNGMVGSINGLSSRLDSVQGKLTTMEGQMTEMQTGLSEMDSKITDLQSQITALSGRVAALEGGTEG